MPAVPAKLLLNKLHIHSHPMGTNGIGFCLKTLPKYKITSQYNRIKEMSPIFRGYIWLTIERFGEAKTIGHNFKTRREQNSSEIGAIAHHNYMFLVTFSHRKVGNSLKELQTRSTDSPPSCTNSYN